MARGEDRGARIGTGALTISLPNWTMVCRVLAVEWMPNGIHPQRLGFCQTCDSRPALLDLPFRCPPLSGSVLEPTALPAHSARGLVSFSDYLLCWRFPPRKRRSGF